MFYEIVSVFTFYFLHITHVGHRIGTAPEFNGVDYQRICQIANRIYGDNVASQINKLINKLCTDTLVPIYQFTVQAERTDTRTEKKCATNHHGCSQIQITLFIITFFCFTEFIDLTLCSFLRANISAFVKNTLK